MLPARGLGSTAHFTFSGHRLRQKVTFSPTAKTLPHNFLLILFLVLQRVIFY